ncbi:major facilitator superfamily domain-containing protein [Ustulina deusta]|nr:major facilitator superfamily domain-containing protein [Ustulina deusta]
MIEYAACNRELNPAPYAGTYTGSGLDDGRCNVTSVQTQISTITGWKLSFDALAGLLSIAYFGRLAEKRGHRLVLTLCCLGYLCAMAWLTMTCYFYEKLPVYITLVSSAFLLIGGGQLVFAAMTVALVADVVEPSSRTKYLLFLAAMPHSGKLIAPPIATSLMAQNLFLPSLVSGIIILSCMALAQLLTCSTKQQHSAEGEPEGIEEPLLRSSPNHNYHGTTISAHPATPDNQTIPERDTDSGRHVSPHGAENTTISRFMSSVAHFVELASACTINETTPLFCYAAFFLKSNAMASEAFGAQYLAERFGWDLQNTTIIRFALSLSAVIATVAIGPFVSFLLKRQGASAATISLYIIRVSLLVLTAFFLVAWRAESSKLFIVSMLGAGLCEGLEPALQTLLSVSTRSEEMSRPFGVAYAFSLLGDMTGGPLMSALISIGRATATPSAGFCFLGSSFIFGAIGVLAFCVPRGEGHELSSSCREDTSLDPNIVETDETD